MRLNEYWPARLFAGLLLGGAFVAPCALAGGGPISLGKTVSGVLGKGQSDVWNIDLRQGQFVRIEMSRQIFASQHTFYFLEPEVAFAREGGATLGVASSTNGAGTVRLVANCLAQTGRYTITARSHQGASQGRYSLLIDAIENVADLGAVTQPCPATDALTDRTYDKCGRTYVGVTPPYGSPVPVQKGETKFIFIPADGEIKWSCYQDGEYDEERAKCVNGSNLVRISRAPTGRDIAWTCYTRRFVTSEAAIASQNSEGRR